MSTTKLKLLLAAMISLLVLGLSGQGPKAADTPKSLRNTLRTLFSHQKHHDIFQQHQIQCTHCHVMNISTAKESEEKARQFSETMLSKVGQGVCHLCHNNPKAAVPAPKQCSLCHNLDPSLKPVSHTLDWISWHGSQAKTQQQSCTQCHHSQDCQRCHSPSPSGFPLRNVHPGNFEDLHSIPARINSKTCSTCHTPNYCLRCHERGR